MRRSKLELEQEAKKKNELLNKQEIELYETKWFDYRTLSPDLATMKFMHAYAEVQQLIFGFSINTG